MNIIAAIAAMAVTAIIVVMTSVDILAKIEAIVMITVSFMFWAVWLKCNDHASSGGVW